MPSQSELPEEQQLVWHYTPIPCLAREVNLGTPTAIAAGARTFDVLEPQVLKVELVRLVGLERPLWSFWPRTSDKKWGLPAQHAAIPRPS